MVMVMGMARHDQQGFPSNSSFRLFYFYSTSNTRSRSQFNIVRVKTCHTANEKMEIFGNFLIKLQG